MFNAEASRFATRRRLQGPDEVGGKKMPTETSGPVSVPKTFVYLMKRRNVSRGERMKLSLKLIFATLFAVLIVPVCFAKIVMATSPDASMRSEKSSEAKEQEDLKFKAALHAEEGPAATEPSEL